MKKLILLLCLSIAAIGAEAKVWLLADSNLEIKFDDQTSSLTVKDKRCNKVWQQGMLDSGQVLSKFTQGANNIRLSVTGTTSFSAQLMLTKDSELEISLTGDESKPMGELKFPGAFASPKDHFMLMTDGEGLLLPVEDQQYPLGSGIMYFCGGGNAMSWMGVVDKNLSSGYMAILETPYDAALRASRQKGMVTFQPVWLAAMGKFGYTRKVTYVFFNKGGYVAQCKRYRKEVWTKTGMQTLKEKVIKTPSMAKMVGGVHIYVWDNARNATFAQELKDSGISKALFLWNPNHLPYPAKGYDDSLRALGYVYGSYELFTDIHLRDTAWYDLLQQPNFLKRNQHPGLYNQLVARKKNGTVYSNQFGHYICPKAVMQEIVKRTAKEKELYNTENYFVDVYQANGIYECYSKDHPCTRQEWAEAIKRNQQYLLDSCHTFLGGEWGADFAANQIVYCHGMMTLQRTWWGPEINKKGTIYYYGDWRNPTKPTQALGIRTAPPNYMKYSIKEILRVPLFDLVYHDAIVTSWRWEDGNHHMPEIWWKKDLFNILYGNAPLWNIDKDHWVEFKNTFIESYKKIHPWLQQVAYDEMVSHRFVTPDHKVQQSTFSSGKKAVVNFGDDEFVFEGKLIKPRSFIIKQ